MPSATVQMEESSLYGKRVLVGTGIAFSILPTIAVGLRFYARRIGGAKLGLDDWLMVPALVGFDPVLFNSSCRLI
jgi:hypothetical protein